MRSSAAADAMVHAVSPLRTEGESITGPARVVVQNTKVLVQGAGAAKAPAVYPNGVRLVDGFRESEVSMAAAPQGWRNAQAIALCSA